MASTIDVVPASGHALLSTQNGIGSSPGYDAIDLRRIAEVGFQEGVQKTSGWLVSAHPSTLQVDIAQSGIATVKGDSIADQGNYVVPPHSSTATLDVAAANASNPRIDQVLLHVYDSAVDGLGKNTASMEMLTGTATAGASLANRTGAAALPNSAMLLADVLIPATSTSVSAANIRDRRPWMNGAAWIGTRTTPNLDLTGVANMSAVDTSALRARIEVADANNVIMITFSGSGINLSTGLMLDTVAYPTGSASLGLASHESGAAAGAVGYTFAVIPGAGSHLFAAGAMRFASGTSTLFSGPNRPIVFSLQEIISQSANNGTS